MAILSDSMQSRSDISWIYSQNRLIYNIFVQATDMVKIHFLNMPAKQLLSQCLHTKGKQKTETRNLPPAVSKVINIFHANICFAASTCCLINNKAEQCLFVPVSSGHPEAFRHHPFHQNGSTAHNLWSHRCCEHRNCGKCASCSTN